jgi:MFS family permease
LKLLLEEVRMDAAVHEPKAPTRVAPKTASGRLALLSACLGWMFDAFDLQLFRVILFPCIGSLTGSTNAADVAYLAGIVSSAKLLAWGLGGIIFGVVADRIGRSRTMMVTVLINSGFTGLSAIAGTWWQLAILQALAGIGIGGEWAAGAALVAETAPDASRPRFMQIMQMSFAGGFLLAAATGLLVGPFGWRWVLAIGALPAVLTLFIRRYVPEPERWLEARRQTDVSAWTTFVGIFAPGLRRRVAVGATVSAAMMIGSWGVTTLLPLWVHQLFPVQDLSQVKVTSVMFIAMNIGAVGGYIALMWLSAAAGRRWSYFIMALGALLSALVLFSQVTSLTSLLWLVALYGFFAIGGFGAFAAYLPELFPTRIRATGQGFCWNLARTFTAAGPFVAGSMVSTLGSLPKAAMAVTAAYAVGALAIWFGPETRGRNLED